MNRDQRWISSGDGGGSVPRALLYPDQGNRPKRRYEPTQQEAQSRVEAGIHDRRIGETVKELPEVSKEKIY